MKRKSSFTCCSLCLCLSIWVSHSVSLSWSLALSLSLSLCLGLSLCLSPSLHPVFLSHFISVQRENEQSRPFRWTISKVSNYLELKEVAFMISLIYNEEQLCEYKYVEFMRSCSVFHYSNVLSNVFWSSACLTSSHQNNIQKRQYVLVPRLNYISEWKILCFIVLFFCVAHIIGMLTFV